MKRILIVDDEPGINLTLKMGLEEGGFHVDTFDDPNVPLDNLRKAVYDMLILDIKIPKIMV